MTASESCRGLGEGGGEAAATPTQLGLPRLWLELRRGDIRRAIQSIIRSQSVQLYHTSEYECVQTFMKYECGTARHTSARPPPEAMVGHPATGLAT